MKNVTILGSTGSIGVSTLDVIARHPDRYRAFALSAANKVDALAEQCRRFNPRYAVMVNNDAAEQLRASLSGSGLQTEVLSGAEALETIAAHADTHVVMAAIVGAAGLPGSMAAARAGKTVLLANKEALVMAGRMFMDAIRDSGATLLPIDSEHNAVFQSLPRGFADAGLSHAGVRRIVLTASGGPFRTRSLDQLANVTPDEACAHPNWVMGRKISVDSATMMNKGLEVIEAHWLFDASADMIDVLIHPQSVVHSMVEYVDGSFVAQLGSPDMRTPIAYGLGYPDRIDAGVKRLDLASVAKLEFHALDLERFPCVRLAYDALRMGGAAPAVLNAANEVAVEAFLNHRLRFVDIPHLIESVCTTLCAQSGIAHADSIEAVLAADTAARQQAQRFVQEQRVSA